MGRKSLDRRRRTPVPTRRGGAITFAVIGVLVATLAVLAYGPTLNPIDLVTGKPLFLEAPDVVGLSQPAAVLEAAARDLKVDVEFGFYNDVPRGKVARQSPEPGGGVEEGASMTVVVSRGPAFIEVPDLVGRNEQPLVDHLTDAGLSIEIERVNNEDLATGTILAQSLRAGRVVRGGTELSLTVSKGPVERAVPVVAGIPLEGALYRLGAAGLVLLDVQTRDDPSAPVGAVIGTEPGSGIMVKKDTKIRVVVSAGPPPFDLPGVVGRSVESARETLGSLGVILSEITQVGAVGDPNDGAVLSQNPVAGTQVRVGDPVAITVLRAAPPPTTTTTTTTPETSTTSSSTTTTSEP